MEIHLAITAHSHGLGLVVDFNNVHSSCGSVSSVNQTSRKPKAGSNPLIEKYTSPAEPETNTHQQKWKSGLKIILVQMEQQSPWWASHKEQVQAHNWIRHNRASEQSLAFVLTSTNASCILDKEPHSPCHSGYRSDMVKRVFSFCRLKISNLGIFWSPMQWLILLKWWSQLKVLKWLLHLSWTLLPRGCQDWKKRPGVNFFSPWLWVD